jgi:hypothetical protein
LARLPDVCFSWGNIGSTELNCRVSSLTFNASRSAASARTERANAHLLSIAKRETTLPITYGVLVSISAGNSFETFAVLNQHVIQSPGLAVGTSALIRVWASVPGMASPIQPHMLRHACVYALANTRNDTRALQAWMWHKSSNIHALSRVCAGTV